MVKAMGFEVSDIRPWSIQVETVEGCNRRCWFCGILSQPEHRAAGHAHGKFIELDLLDKVFRDLNDWLPKIRVEINSHGEPTLHPDFMGCLSTMRKAMPTACLNLQTNCEVWVEEGMDYIEAMFDSGLTTLVLNAYKDGMYDRLKEMLQGSPYPVVDYYWDNPKKLSANRYYSPKQKMIFLWDDLGQVNTRKQEGIANHPNKRIHNSGGSSNERVQKAKLKNSSNRTLIRELPWKQKCSKVFRELILDYDGTIPVCCQDWHDVFVMGNAGVENIRDIWYSDRFWAVRQLLFRGRRDLLYPCASCNDPTTRVNLLKDPGIPLTDEELLRHIDITNPADHPRTEGTVSPIVLEWGDQPFPPAW